MRIPGTMEEQLEPGTTVKHFNVSLSAAHQILAANIHTLHSLKFWFRRYQGDCLFVWVPGLEL